MAFIWAHNVTCVTLKERFERRDFQGRVAGSADHESFANQASSLD